MLDSRFALLGGVFVVIGDGTYVIQTFRGRARPNLVTWGLWMAAPLIAFGGEVTGGVGLQSVLAFTTGFLPMLVVIAALMRRNTIWKIGKLDIVCGVLSVLALLGWLATRANDIAITLAIAADALAGVPTVIKSYRNPESESPWAYVGSLAGAVITVLTISDWSFREFAFPIYLVGLNSTLAFLILFRPKGART
jgi:hypothetical protein